MGCEESPTRPSSREVIIDDQGSIGGMPAAGEMQSGESIAGSQAGEMAGEMAGDQGGTPISPLPPPFPPLEPATLEGEAQMVNEPPTGVRIGWIDEEGEALSGQDVSCRVGSARLENSIVRICIQGQSSLTQFKRRGGNLVDAMRWDAPGVDGISEIMVAPGWGEVDPEEILIVADGSEGGPAVLQVRGSLNGSRILTSYLPSWVPRPLSVINEYHLYPDRADIELHTWLSVGESPARVQMTDFVVWADTARFVYPLQMGNRIPAEPAYLGAHKPKISYLWRIDGVDHVTVTVLPDLPFQPVSLGEVIAPAGTELYMKRVLHVGRGGVSPLADELGLGLAEARPVSLQLTAISADDTPLTEESEAALRPSSVLNDLNVEVFTVAENGGRGVFVAQTRSVILDGLPQVRLQLPSGQYWVSCPQWYGGAFEQQVTIPEMTEGDTGQELTLDFTLPAPALLQLSERLKGEGEVTLNGVRGSKWIFTPLGDGPPNREQEIHFILGSRTLLLPSGSWRLDVTRGWHFSASRQELTLDRGQVQAVEVSLTEELPMSGWSAGEFHQHSAPSLDSDISFEQRILSNIAEGVGFMVPSDHDVLVDYPAMVSQFGYSADIGAPITGVEVSPRAGHLGAYGMTYAPEDPQGAGGAPPLSKEVTPSEDGSAAVWAIRTIPELINEARARGAEVVQLNHPRDSTGYFDTVGFDPTAAEPPVDHEQWTDQINTVEVFNGAGDLCKVMRDWQALLLQGQRITAVGNSDSHSLDRPVGYPRNYLPTSAERAQLITRQEVVEALLQGRSSIGGGAVIELTGEMRWGDLISGSEVNIPLRLRTPSFTSLTRVVAWYNGREVWSTALSAPAEALVDFDEIVTLQFEEEGFLIFFAEGPTLEHVHSGQPTFALSNPLWVDLDGDQEISLPSPYRAPDEVSIPFCN